LWIFKILPEFSTALINILIFVAEATIGQREYAAFLCGSAA
jgi:hypothetical protein